MKCAGQGKARAAVDRSRIDVPARNPFDRDRCRTGVVQALNTLLAAAHLIYQGTETYPPSTGPLPTSPVMLTIAPPVTAAPPTTGPTSVAPTTQATLPAISTPQPQIPSAAAPRVDLPSLVITLALGVVLAGIAWLHPSV